MLRRADYSSCKSLDSSTIKDYEFRAPREILQKSKFAGELKIRILDNGCQYIQITHPCSPSNRAVRKIPVGSRADPYVSANWRNSKKSKMIRELTTPTLLHVLQFIW
jgi:hypothetical protein